MSRGPYEVFNWYAHIFQILNEAGIEVESSEPIVELIDEAVNVVMDDVQATQELNREDEYWRWFKFSHGDRTLEIEVRLKVSPRVRQ